MLLKGKHNIAKIFTDEVEETAIDQIVEMLNQDFVKMNRLE